MTRNRLGWATLLACTATVLGCPPPDPNPPWDGGFPVLEEKGNWPNPPGRLSPCTVLSKATGESCGDLGTFDLSACNRGTLANAATQGNYLLTHRFEDVAGNSTFIGASTFTFPSDGGTPYLNGALATEQRDGNSRLFSVTTSFADGGTRRTSIVTCEAPQAPEFTGCYAACRNGQLTSRATFQSERLTWRAGESESSGLELVSESRVTLGYPVDIYVAKGHAYVVSINRQGRTGGLTVFDVANKTAPVKVKTVEVQGDSYWNGVWAKDDALYIASNTRGVLVYDIRDPADPRFVTHLGGNTNTHTVFVDGNRLYATSNTGIGIYDVTTATHPVLLNHFAPQNTYPHDMFAVGDRLYANYADKGYIVADTSNPRDIRTLGAYNYPGQYSHANAVGTFAGRTIAFMGGEGPGEHLRVLDVTNPANIVKIGRFQLRPAISIHNMVLSGQRLYVAWYQEGVRVLDVSNPTQPTQVAHYNTYRESDPNRGDYYDGAIGIRLPGDGFLYVVDTSRGLLILREP